MQPRVAHTNNKQGKNIPQGLLYIWEQTMRQGNLLVCDQKVH
jgi:hypothetical protein